MRQTEIRRKFQELEESGAVHYERQRMCIDNIIRSEVTLKLFGVIYRYTAEPHRVTKIMKRAVDTFERKTQEKFSS